MLHTLSVYSGVIASIWIVLGVYIAASYYPGYSHQRQFCSELGAVGSPTQKLSPRINNYPLGLLFLLCGWHVISIDNAHISLHVAGYLIGLHGIGTWVAGYFPMDADPYTKTPSRHCKIHSWAGFIMLLSLLIAPICIALGPTSLITPISIRLISVAAVLITVYYLYKMVIAIRQQTNPGLQQRLSYGVQLLWLCMLSLSIA